MKYQADLCQKLWKYSLIQLCIVNHRLFFPVHGIQYMHVPSESDVQLVTQKWPRSQSHNWKRLTGQQYDWLLTWSRLGVTKLTGGDLRWTWLAAATQSAKMCILAAFYPPPPPPLHGGVYTIIFVCGPMYMHTGVGSFLMIRLLSITSISIVVIFTPRALRS